MWIKILLLLLVQNNELWFRLAWINEWNVMILVCIERVCLMANGIQLEATYPNDIASMMYKLLHVVYLYAKMLHFPLIQPLHSHIPIQHLSFFMYT